MSPMELVFLGLLVLAANVVEATTGFGATILAVTIGSHHFSIDELVVTLVPLNILLSIWIVTRHRRQVDLRRLFTRLVPATLVGVALGVTVFLTAPPEALKRGYGVFVFLFASFELVRILRSRGDAQPRPLSKPAAFIWLLGGGLAQGIFASGGPLVVYYASREIPDKGPFRATLSGLWLVLNIVLLASHAAAGRTTVTTLTHSALLIPSLAVGILLGELLHHRIPNRAFRIMVFALLILAGGALVLSS